AMWNVAGAATPTSDVYAFALTSATTNIVVYETGLAAGGKGQYLFDQLVWKGFVDSNAGPAQLTVAPYSGGKAMVVKEQPYVIAPQDMLGTIYYWSIGSGRIMRIRVGQNQLDDFFANTKDDWPGNANAPIGCPACHTVSAKGSRLVM